MEYILILQQSIFDLRELIYDLHQFILGFDGRCWAFGNHFRPLGVFYLSKINHKTIGLHFANMIGNHYRNFFAIFESLKVKNEETRSKLDSNQSPQKHHTIPADVLPNASEDLLIIHKIHYNNHILFRSRLQKSLVETISMNPNDKNGLLLVQVQRDTCPNQLGLLETHMFLQKTQNAYNF